jgi:RimJ/RimL family protein N-acetyltransferase
MSEQIVAATGRLTLRHWVPEDAEPYFALFQSPDVIRHFTQWPRSVSEARAASLQMNEWDVAPGLTTWAVILSSTGTLIGSCGFARTNAAWLQPECVEIGWMLGRLWWGEGFATEAGAAALRRAVGVVEPRRIVSKCDARNTASERVMTRIGMRRAGAVSRGDGCTVVYRLPCDASA